MRTTCPYCGVGCGLKVSSRCIEGNRASDFEIAGDPDHPANLGRLCSKSAALSETLGLEDRLLHPEIGGRRVSWDEALNTVAQRFTDARKRYGPDATAFYVSGQLLTEDYYVANKLMKGFIGSANIDTNSRLCMASAVAGYKRAFGTDTVPCTYVDVEEAELIVLVGSNAAWCHPVLFQRIMAAKAARPDLKVVVVDPRRTATADAADLFLPIAPGTDAVLFNGLLNHLRREDALDWSFLEAHTEDFAAAISAAKASGSVPAVARACGLADAAVAEFFRWFAVTARTVTLFSQGVNQSSSGTDKVNAIINVHLATGRVGSRGAGPFSLTGQPNAMGGREVGGLANQLAAHMSFTPEAIDRVRRFWSAPSLAERPGLNAVELFDAVESGRIKALWIMCTNPVVTMPDADRVERALHACDFVVVSDCMSHTDTTACADVLLPAATWGEKSGTVTNSERRISRQRAFLLSPGESRPDWWIVSQVARRMGFEEAFPYDSPWQIFREHVRLSAFENEGTRAFDIGALGEITPEEYDVLEPVQWPLPLPRPGGEPLLQLKRSSSNPERVSAEPKRRVWEQRDRIFANGRFFTPSGKARLVPVEPRLPRSAPDATHPLVLNTGRIRDQWHTMTRTGMSARLSGHKPEPFVEVHPHDALRFGVEDGGLAEVISAEARLVLRVAVTDSVGAGQIFVAMHWTKQIATLARVGALIPGHTDPLSGQPELKHAVAAVRPYRPAWQAFVLSCARLRVDGFRRPPPSGGRRAPAHEGECTYVACSKGAGHWRSELAGDSAPESWPSWSRRLVSEPGDWIEFADCAAGRYRAALISEDRLQACVFVTMKSDLPSRHWVGGLFERRLDAGTRRALLSGRSPGPSTDPGPLVCSCFSIGRAKLTEAIRSRRLVTVEQIGRVLKAGTNCGSCLGELSRLLTESR